MRIRFHDRRIKMTHASCTLGQADSTKAKAQELYLQDYPQKLQSSQFSIVTRLDHFVDRIRSSRATGATDTVYRVRIGLVILFRPLL